ncbi:hypothetical protein BGZ94_000118 [Podila epigama]|nr:hypothetical protein BGZ94_000118 [Podila epigama]
MTNNNPLTLFCLVDGESTPFPVEIESTKTIGDLKDAIKDKKAPRFDDVAADELTLWRVSIPDADDDENDEESPVLLDSIPSKDKKKLKATHDLSDVFKETPPKKTIHIIVQRPAPACTPTPTQRVSVPQDRIEQELKVILSGTQHHFAHQTVYPKDVEAFQKERLGPFFNRTLPYHTTAKDIQLAILGLELGKQAKASDGRTTLCSIVEDDISRFSNHRVVAMVAPSGSGKTATVFDLATKHFVVYCVCRSTKSTISPEFEDPNFAQLAIDVEDMYAGIVRTQGAAQSLLDIEAEANRLARHRVELEFLARLLFLHLLLNHNPELEPWQFFREQTTNGGALTISNLIHKLRGYDGQTIGIMLGVVQTKLRVHLDTRRLGLAIALDEAQAAATSILAGRFISPSALAAYWNTRNSPSVLFDDKNEIHRHLRRGFLTPLSATLSRMQATLVILGTALSLQDADHVYTAVGKPTNFIRITDFPVFDQEDVSKMLSELVDLTDCEIPAAKRRKLSGRARFSIGIVNHLITTGPTQKPKQVTLDNAVDHTIEHVTRGLRSGIHTILQSDYTGEAARLFCRMVLAYHFRDGKVLFSSSKQADFVDKALCRLRAHSDGAHLIMNEPIVIEAVEEELKASSMDPTFSGYMDQLTQLISSLGRTSATKGNALEPLVHRSLQRFNGYLISDLPFLKNLDKSKLPSWCHGLRLQIDDVNTAKGFGRQGDGAAADLDFLINGPSNMLLSPSNGTRPDGLWLFPNRHYAGSLAIKFFSSPLAQAFHESNTSSSDVRACFLKADGVISKPLKNVRADYEASGIPSNIRGMLRIHLVLPGVQGITPVTQVVGEDVMVFIHLDNMDRFFYGDIEANKEDMVTLKNLIRFVCTSR